MTIYKSNICLKDFRQKCHLDDHLNKKKKPCLSPSIQICENNTQTHTNNTQTHTNNTQKSQLILQPINNMDLLMHKALRDYIDKRQNIHINEINIFCEYCNKEFVRKDSLTRHLKNFCKYKKQNDDKDLIIKTLIEEVSLLKGMVKKDCLSHNTNSNNSMNNSHNKTTNNNINQNIQVNINGFGKEDLEKLDIKEAMNIYLKSTGGNIIPNMLNYINLNKNYPENHNICMTDISREIVKMHNGKKYVYKKFKNAKFDIVDRVVDNINGIVGIYKDGDYKKSEDIDKKININDTSLKLISGEELVESEEDIEPDKMNHTKEDVKSVNSEDIINDLVNMDENIQKMIKNREKVQKKENHKININHLNSKKEGLQKLTYDKLKDELYNNRELIERHDKFTKT